MATPSAIPKVITDNLVGAGEALLPYTQLLPPIAIGVVTAKGVQKFKRKYGKRKYKKRK